MQNNSYFTRLSEWGYRKSSGKTTLLMTLIFLAFGVIVLPGAANAAAEYSEGIGSIDLGFGNSAENVISILKQYGEKGRNSYLQARWSFDLIFPLVFTIFGFSVNSYLGNIVEWDTKRLSNFNILIVVGMIFDYLENIFASILILTIQNPSYFVAYLLSIFSILKWIFVGASFITIFLLLITIIHIKFSK